MLNHVKHTITVVICWLPVFPTFRVSQWIDLASWMFQLCIPFRAINPGQSSCLCFAVVDGNNNDNIPVFQLFLIHYLAVSKLYILVCVIT